MHNQSMTANIEEFESKSLLADKLCGAICEILNHAIEQKGSAQIAFSGGSTPKLLFKMLSKQDVNWRKIKVLLVDERCVPADNSRSNERLLRETLMVDNAAEAEYVSIRDQDFSTYPLDLDIAILGMGNDGHTASFFPGGDNLANAVSKSTMGNVVEISAPGAPEPRITLTLPAIASASQVFLHIEGEDKRETLQRALAGGPPEEMPIRYVLQHPDIALQTFWTP